LTLHAPRLVVCVADNAFPVRPRTGRLGLGLGVALHRAAFNFAFGGAQYYGAWLRDSIISIFAGAVVLIAIFVRVHWVQVAVAAIFASLATYFLLATSSLGAA